MLYLSYKQNKGASRRWKHGQDAIKAKITAQLNLALELFREYQRINEIYRSERYYHMAMGLRRALEIISEELNEPVLGHDLLEYLKSK